MNASARSGGRNGLDGTSAGADSVTPGPDDSPLFDVSPDGRVVPTFEAPARARDAGVALVEAATDQQGRAVVDQAIRVHAQSGRPFSVNDFRELLPAERANLLGARVLAAAKRGEITRLGYEPAPHAAGHGRPVAVWVAAPTSGGGVR